MTPLAALFRRPPADLRTDGALLAAFLRDRDEPAFAELVRRHGPLVWGACRRLLPDPADAEDAFQAAFLVLVRRAGRLTAAPTVGPWLLKVAMLTARNARRKNARRLARTAPLPDALPDPRPASEPAEIDAALLGLPERCRAAVLLTHLEGLTHREAADRLGCAEGTVSSLVSRGLARLRHRLGREPAALLAVLTVPSGVEAAAVRSASAAQLASASASTLAREVLRMFWVRKAAAGAATLVVLVAGFAAGLSVRQAPEVTGQEKKAVEETKQERAGESPPAGKADVGYLVFTVRPKAADRMPYSLAEFDAKGNPRWTVVPGVDLAAPWNTGDRRFDLSAGDTQQLLRDGTREYLARARTDSAGPRELRVVFDGAVEVGGFPLEALRLCREAGYESIKFTGYVPRGGFIPGLMPGPDGEAPGYTRYTGGPVETKKLVADYERAMRTY